MPPLRIVIEETEPGKFHVHEEPKPSPCAHTHPPEVPTGPCEVPSVKEESPSTSSSELDHAARTPEEMPTGIRIDSCKDVYLYHYDDFSKRTQEVFVVGCLSVSGELIGKPYEVALGQRAEVGVEVVDIVRPVIQTNASGYYALHFHPSGHAKPSKADIELTEMIAAHTKANLPGVAFVDHIVIGCFASASGETGGEYCSIHETKKIYDGKTHEVIGTVRGYAKSYSRGGPSQKAARASARAKESEGLKWYATSAKGRTKYVWGPYESKEAAAEASYLRRSVADRDKYARENRMREYVGLGVEGYEDDELKSLIMCPEENGYAKVIVAKKAPRHPSWADFGEIREVLWRQDRYGEPIGTVLSSKK